MNTSAIIKLLSIVGYALSAICFLALLFNGFGFIYSATISASVALSSLGIKALSILVEAAEIYIESNNRKAK